MRSGGGGRTLRVLGGLLALYLAVPLVAFVVRLVRSSNPGFGQPGLYPALAVSAETATISAIVIALFGLPLAYALARSKSRIATAVGLIAQLPLALPPLMSGIILIYLVGPYSAAGRFFHQRLTESIIGVVLAQCFVAAPFLVAVARAAFADVDPALFDLAATLGYGESARFFRVALPAARGGVSAGILLCWLRAFGEYGATVILAYHPYTLPVFTYLQFSGVGLTGTEAPTALALGLAAVVVLAARLASRPRRIRRDLIPEEVRRPSLPARATAAAPLRFSTSLRLGDFSLEVTHAAASPNLAILGPSGSGKTATLRSIAGLFGPATGSVHLGDELVSGLRTEERGFGYVPQSGSLFPDRSVWRQVTFGTRADSGLAAYWLDRLDLGAFAGHLPRELSGGQRQRVHLAQALATSPRLLLLDEPFSALDAPVRASLRLEFRRLQREAGLASVLVTHDPEEAAMLADELLVISGGRLLQAGPRDAVFSAPASPEVARLLGIENVLSGHAEDGALRVGDLRLPIAVPLGAELVRWCIDARHVVVSKHGSLEASVAEIIDRGLSQMVVLDLGRGQVLLAEATRSIPLRSGMACRFDLDPDAVTVWSAPLTTAPSAG